MIAVVHEQANMNCIHYVFCLNCYNQERGAIQRSLGKDLNSNYITNCPVDRQAGELRIPEGNLEYGIRCIKRIAMNRFIIFIPGKMITSYVWITKKQTLTTGLRNCWIASLISLLAAQIQQNSIGYCLVSGFGAFCSYAKIPMMFFAFFSSMIVYTGWRDHFDQDNNDVHVLCGPTCPVLCKKKINALIFTTPIISVMSFFFSMFAMAALWVLNAITFNSIVYMGGTYAALKITTIGSLSLLENDVPATSTRSRVLTKITRIGGLIAGGIILVLPVALPLLFDYSYYTN